MLHADMPGRRLRAAASFLLWSLLFGLVYCQAPLYYSNQNQYFLHGLADAGLGYLRDDWLASTADPTPIFSALVALTARYLHPVVFHLYYGLLLGVYLASMMGVFSFLAGPRWTPRLRLVFLALLLLVHSAAARWLSYQWLGLDYPWYFQAGLAGQYALGAIFQPSTFGVLLILSVVLFLKDRPFLAVASAVLAASVHSTYLLAAAILTLAYLCALLREGQVRQALLLGLWGLALVLPVTAYTLTAFRPTSADAFVESQHLLAHLRIPHHSLPRLWCDAIALGQVAWVVLALVLVRGTRLFVVLGVAFLASLILTLLQVVTGSDSLALLFPWRVSVVLVPVATAVILARLVLACARWVDRPAAGIASVALIALLCAGGLAIAYYRLGFQSGGEELPMMNFVRDSKSPGDVYLIPVEVPKLAATTRGSLSSDFKPVADKRSDQRLIPVDLQRFRLYTGAPIFVDFKSIPYKDTDVLAWHERLGINRELYGQLRAGKADEALPELRRHGITHVVLTANHPLEGADFEQVYKDDAYRVVRLRTPRR